MSVNMNEEQINITEETNTVVETPAVTTEEKQGTPVTPQPTTINPTKKTVKKPKKIGWIITLVFSIISIIVAGVGMYMTVSGLAGLEHEVTTSKIPVESIGNGKLKVSQLEVGKKYMAVFTKSEGPVVTTIKVDGEESAPLPKVEDSIRLFEFTSRKESVTMTLVGITEKSRGNIDVVESEAYTSYLMKIGIGAIIFAVGIFLGLINGILFIIFLILFLVKNNKYKRSL
ncbi:MAG: hypothetical protein ACRCV7_06005 [Culicoidibacterales bacterium]